MMEIHKWVKQLEDEKLDRQLSVIEAYKNESSKCFQSMRNEQNKPKNHS